MRLIGCNLLTLAVLMIPIELGLRFFDFLPAWTTSDYFLPDPDLLWVPRGYSDRVVTASRSYPSIVFMGDSRTYKGRYDEKLEAIFEARNPAFDLTFVNVGVEGWSSWQGLRQLQRDVLSMRPKAVTIFYGWNDISIVHPNGLADKDAARPFIREPFTLRIAQFAQFFFRRFAAVPGSDRRVSLTDFRANLRQMVRIARNNGIVPILLTSVASRHTVPATLVSLHRQYAEAVREVAAAEDAPLVDLHREFDRLHRQDLERFFLESGVHLSPAGNQKAAELIDQHLVEAGLYPRIIAGGGELARAEGAFERFKEEIGDGRLLHQGTFDVWLGDGRLVYLKDRCVGPQGEFFLHVWPVDPDDLPEERKEHGFDNLDFEFSWIRLGFTQGCAASRRFPDYPVAAVRTGQFVPGFPPSWEMEVRFGPAGRAPMGEHLADRVRGRRPEIDADVDVYLVDGTLVYVKESCGPEDADARFFLHVDPIDPDDLPVPRRPHGFDNLDFRFDGARFEGACLAEAALPAYRVAAIRTGEIVEGEGGLHRSWEGEIRFAEVAARFEGEPRGTR